MIENKVTVIVNVSMRDSSSLETEYFPIEINWFNFRIEDERDLNWLRSRIYYEFHNVLVDEYMPKLSKELEKYKRWKREHDLLINRKEER